jgi:hypothetical protein
LTGKVRPLWSNDAEDRRIRAKSGQPLNARLHPVICIFPRARKQVGYCLAGWLDRPNARVKNLAKVAESCSR